ncbi:MAG TPA: DUF4232 domain-containing protein [Acidimicrobiales bacterium]|nr:DUF4232 domain-containing protein [Acidimicrobiales bacterium]
MVFLLAVGCSSGSKSSSSGTSTTTAPTGSTSTTAAPTSTAGATTSSSASGSTSTSARTVARCHTSQLGAAVGQGQGAAGSTYVTLTLTNHSSTACTVQGYAGVSLLDASGHQIGSPATRATGPSASIVVAPGGVASTTVHTLNAGVAPGGCWAPSTSVKIYPPDELDSVTAPGSITVCGNTFTVTPMVSGAG